MSGRLAIPCGRELLCASALALLPVQFTKPFLAGGHFAVEPRSPFAADFDGDGFADLGCVYSAGVTIVDVSRSDAGTKFRSHDAAARLEGFETRAFALGELAGGRDPDLALLSTDGRIAVLHGYAAGKMESFFAARDVAETDGAILAAGDFEGSASGQILLARPSGRWTIFRPGAEGFEASELEGPAGLKALVPLQPFGEPSLAALDAEGRLCFVAKGPRGFAIRETTSFAAEPARLVAGDFDGDGKADLLAGRSLLLGAAPDLPVELPELRLFPEPFLLVAADLNADRRSDILLFRRDAEPEIGRDIHAFLSYREGDPDPDFDGLTDEEEKSLGTDPLSRDTDEDGLLDGWEAKGAYALDLAALGCSPRRKDVVCLVQRGDNVDGARLAKELRRAQEFFAALPVANPDGSQGIGLVLSYLRPLDAAKGEGNKPWWELGEAAIPKELRGIAHYTVVGRGGGGQSAQMGEMGGIGDGTAYACFLHEFGHQLGLDHSGRSASWSPLYTSLMNYQYSYGFDGEPAKIHYSRGEFASVRLQESALSEKLPFPIEKLRFLEKDPNRFALKAEGDSTWVDWDRNGRFDEGPVRADIDCSYGADGGLRATIGKALFAPVFAVAGGRAFLFSVRGGGGLERRDYEGGEKWGSPVTVKESGVVGDPYALAGLERSFLFLPVAEGVEFWVGPAPDRLERIGLLPESRGASPAGVSLEGRTLVFLWDGAEKPIRVLEQVAAGWEKLADLPLVSAFPPGAVYDPDSRCVLFGIGLDQDERRKSRWQLVRARFEPENSFLVVERRWVSGESGSDAGSFRPNLLLEPRAEGNRVYWIATGLMPAGAKSSCFWAAVEVGDRSYRDGWLTKRYYDEWTSTASPAAAAWFGGDVLLAFRWHGDVGERKTDNDLIVSHRGLCISDEPVGDFDDVSFIAKVGLQRSILWRR